MINAEVMAIIGAAVFGIAAALTVLVALGLPLGEFTMGGKHKVMPPERRLLCWGSAAVQIFAIIVILQTGSVIPVWFPLKITRGICFFFAAYLSLNSVMNFLSDSMKEKVFMTPLSVLAAICFWAVAFS